MSGIAQGGTVLTDGSAIAIAGQTPTGIAIAGNQVWSGAPSWQLLSQATVTGMGMQGMTIDTTDASVLIFLCAAFGDTFYGLTDNQNNTWIRAGLIPTQNRDPNLYFYYVLNPVTSSAHLIQSGGDYKTSVVAAFNGPPSITLDQFSQTNYRGAPASQQIPAITPTAPGLFIAGAGLNSYNASIDSGFTTIYLVPRTGSYGIGFAYLLNKDTSPVSPTWSYFDGWNVLAGDNPIAMVNFIP